jgi:hypothetical protein
MSLADKTLSVDEEQLLSQFRHDRNIGDAEHIQVIFVDLIFVIGI